MSSLRNRLLSSLMTPLGQALILGGLLMPAPAGANPEDGQVVAGQATISQTSPVRTDITQQTDRAIIDWRAFSIGAGESVHFDQPNAQAIALNRVIGGDPSAIFGDLSANGQVWLINPNGVAFGPSARVDVAGLLATTLDIDNADFMAGNYRFTDNGLTGARVSNAGTITVADRGLAALVAPGVDNSGVIQARLGHIQLSAATGFTLDLYGDGLFNFLLDGQVTQSMFGADSVRLEAAVSNSGSLYADGGRVFLTADVASTVVDRAVNMDGYIQARSVSSANGEIVLDGGAEGAVVVAGVLDASGVRQGEAGGRIGVTGQTVALDASARLLASGDAGGGVVLVGGEYQGGGDFRHAVSTLIASGSLIDVSARAFGDGGSAVIWSDEYTQFEGTILARGGVDGGDGGLSEVSSHGVLSFLGDVDLTAPLGDVGSLLLDPRNVRIAAAGATPSVPTSPGGPIMFNPSMNDSVLSATTLRTALGRANVTVTTGSSGTQAGDIAVDTNVTWSGGNSLTLSAYRNVVINNGAVIANTGSGDLFLRADSTGRGTGTVTFLGTGRVNFQGSSGDVSIFYNPTSSFASPTNYAPFAQFSGPLGSRLTAYMLVNNVTALQDIRNNQSGAYALGRDINASATATWNGGLGFSPIGIINLNNSTLFSGVIEGNGHSISGLRINRPNQSFAALVGVISSSGIVRNLSLVDAHINGGRVVGGIAGLNFGTISGVSVSGVVTVAPNSGSVGGIAGLNYVLGRIEDSRADVNVSGGYHVGGLVGENGATIERSSTTGSVSGHIGEVGGLVGVNSGTVERSFSTSVVSDDSVFGFGVGGLVGHNSLGTVANSYARGQVTGAAFANAGGLVGLNDGSVTSSFATGNMVAGPFSNVGGLIGQENPLGSVSASYWNTQTAGVVTTFVGTGRTTAQLKSGLPSGFSSSVWAISGSRNNGYPYLRWQFPAAAGAGTSISFGAASPGLVNIQNQQTTPNTAIGVSTSAPPVFLGTSNIDPGTFFSELVNARTLPTWEQIYELIDFLKELRSVDAIPNADLRFYVQQRVQGTFAADAIVRLALEWLGNRLEERGILSPTTRVQYDTWTDTARNLAMLNLPGQIVDQSVNVTVAWWEFLDTQRVTGDSLISLGSTVLATLEAARNSSSSTTSTQLRAVADQLLEGSATIFDSTNAGWPGLSVSSEWEIVRRLVEIREKQIANDPSVAGDIAAARDYVRSRDSTDFLFYFRYSTFASRAAASLGVVGW